MRLGSERPGVFDHAAHHAQKLTASKRVTTMTNRTTSTTSIDKQCALDA